MYILAPFVYIFVTLAIVYTFVILKTYSDITYSEKTALLTSFIVG